MPEGFEPVFAHDFLRRVEVVEDDLYAAPVTEEP